MSYWVHGATLPLRDEAGHGKRYVRASESPTFAVTREDMPEGVWGVTAEVDDTPSQNVETLTVLPRTS